LRSAEGYRTGEHPHRYGCQDYSLEMQLLQLKKRLLLETELQIREELTKRIEEIEDLIGM